MHGEPVAVESREVAEFEAREELQRMEEDANARAERHYRAQQVEKRVEILTAELATKTRELDELKKAVRQRRTTLTRKLDRNTWWTQACVVLVLVALVGPTDKVAALVSWILETLTKGRQK